MLAPLTHRPSASTLRALAPLALLLCGYAAFSNSLLNSFVFDDEVWLERNHDIHHLSQPLRWLTTRSEGPAQGRPVAAFTLAANFAWGARRPLGYHVVNLAIHLLAGLALYGVVRRSLLRPPLAAAYARSATGLAFAVALLWTIHPLQTECINYISQRTTSLAGLFYLLVFYCAIRGDRSPYATAWTALAACSCWLGVGCKEIVVTAPFLVALYDACYRSEPLGNIWRRRWKLYAALASSWVPLGLLLHYFPRSRTVGGYMEITPWRYAVNQCVILIEYIQLIFWPRRLSIDYGYPLPLDVWEFAPSALLLLALLAGTIYLLIKRPQVGFLGAWFFVILSPTSSFIPIVTEVGAERRVYLSLAAPLALFVIRGFGWLEHFAERAAERPAAATHLARGAAVLVLLLAAVPLGVRSRNRNADYRSNLMLWHSGLIARPQNPRAHYNFGVQLSHCGADGDAVVMYKKLLEQWPTHVSALNNLAMHYDEVGDHQQAIKHLERAIAAAPDWELPIRNLAMLLASCRDAAYRDGPRARRLGRFLCNELSEKPICLDALAAAYAECGEFEKATRIAELALERARAEEKLEVARQVELRLQLYRQGKPFRSAGGLSDGRVHARQQHGDRLQNEPPRT